MLDGNSLAAAVGVNVDNVAFEIAAQNVPRKILIPGTFDPAKTGVTALVVEQVLSPEQVADTYGLGSMLHRLAIKVFAGGQGIPVFILPQAEAAGVVATGDVDFTGATGVLAGTLHMYIGGDYVPVTITAAMSAADVATAAIAAINAATSLPVTALVNATPEIMDITAKMKGTYGNDVSIAFNLAAGQDYPTGVVAPAITDMTSGATNPSMTTALAALGTGDDANEDFYTDVVNGYSLDTTILDAFSAYVGLGDTLTGLYAKTVSRPFRVLSGDVVAGSAGLTALQVITDARLTDRANGTVSVPDSESHPSEIAALAIGHMARINQTRAAQNYVDIALDGVWPGDKGSDRWTSEYDNRDIAVKAGISPTRVKAGVVYLQNVITFYRPATVPVASNGYREMVNISKIQNLMYTMRNLFEGEKWQGVSIVSDISKVTSTVDRTKARDVDAVKDDLVALYTAWEGKAWIASAAFSITALKEAGSVTVRTGGDGFDMTTKVILSGMVNIIDSQIQFDISFASLN